MNRTDQKTLVKNLCNSIRDEVVSRIKDKSVPENWDGLELRAYLADKFVAETPKGWRLSSWTRKRQKDFKNDVLVSSNL